MHNQSQISTRNDVLRSSAAVAARQLGLITRHQAFRAGMTRTMVDRRVETGQWIRRHPGVYAIAGTPVSWNQKVMAAALAGGDAAMASDLTAAALYGLDGISRGRVGIVVGGTRPLKLRGVVVHRSLILEDRDRAWIDGIPVMSVACTLVHCSSLSLGQLARALDDALVRRLVTRAEVREALDRFGPAPGRQVGKLRRLLAERGAEADTAGSRPEMRLFRVLRSAGVREPVGQHPVRCGVKKYFIDAAYPDFLVALEYQGYDPHRTREAFDEDARRTRALVADGWRVMYFTSKDTDADIVGAVRAIGV